ncbi:hypothetical protein HPB50_027634 [Hyalomma asiaticum]|nr:hypothetical protein HPB50_027634 [Hyalomma asiaticum]
MQDMGVVRGPTPDGPPVKRSAAGQVSPAPAKPNPSLPGPKPAAQGNSSWSNRVRKGPQASSSGGAAFASSPSMIPSTHTAAPSTLPCEHIEFRQLQAQAAALTQVVKALANPTSSASSQAPEATDSAPSERRDTA